MIFLNSPDSTFNTANMKSETHDIDALVEENKSTEPRKS